LGRRKPRSSIPSRSISRRGRESRDAGQDRHREPDKVATRESVQRARAGAGDWRDGLHPRTRRREAGANTFRRTEVHLPHLSFGGVGNGNSPSFQFPTTTPQNTKADAAAAKVAKKVDPGLVDITSTFASQNGTAEGTGMILTSNGLVLTNNHVVEDAATLSVRDVATNTTYVGTVVGYDLSEDVALIQLKGASGLTTIRP